jgi:acyl-homoserine-lactone acylase
MPAARSRLPLWTLVILALVVPLAAPVGAESATARAAEPAPVIIDTDRPELRAEIRRTAHGIPHITAEDFGGIGYGYGYAFAQDNICVIADAYVTVNAQRSKYFGPDESWTFQGNGVAHNNLDSDFFFQRVIDSGVVEDLVSQPPPNGPVDGARQGVRGYVAGYNRYLREVGGPAGISDPACKGAEWVRPITEMDAYRRFYQLALLASSGLAFEGIGGAQPPTPPLPTGGLSSDAGVEQALDQLRSGEVDLNEILGGIGSNAYGIGSEGTRNGKGMVLGNPHFPWQGSERFYQAHLTIPGEVDVAGASLFGTPLILIGHTENMAWSHTVSTTRRLTGYELALVPGSPTTYLVDGRPREMERHPTTVEVRDDNGEVSEQTRTLYSSDYGPILDSLLGLPLFPWTPERAYAIADANAANFRYINHFFEKNQAQTVRDVHRINSRYQGIPWVNTIAADSTGEAYYADIGTAPHVTDEKERVCNTTAQGKALWELARIPVLDGARSMCEWGHDTDAVQPGTFGPSRQPHLFRRDFVSNANDSHWLTNPEEPLEGFATIIGDERTQRSLRTRLTILMAQQRIAGSDGLGAPGFTPDLMTRIAFNNRVHGAEVVIEELVAMCRQQAPLMGGGEPCDVLEAWDRKADLDSRGTHLFRAFFNRASGQPGFWRDSFDPNEPVTTPNEMETLNPNTRNALREAVQQFRNADIPLDAPFGDLQWEMRGDRRIPIHGSTHGEGAFNVISPAPFSASEKGWPDIIHGSSFVMAAAFTDGCPDVRTMMTYSQSTDPTSPWFADQTLRYSQKDWVRPPFCAADVAAQTITRETISERAPGRVERLGGDNRVATAVEVSRATFLPARTDTVVLARADAYPDALAGAPLATDLGAPILLTSPAGLDDEVEDEIRRLGVSRAVLLGGEAALSAAVASDLSRLGVGDVERVAGDDRFATAAAIARRLGASERAFVVEGAHPDAGRGWPDALSAAPYAAFASDPILLVTRDEVPEATTRALRDAGVEEVVVVGGPAAVSQRVLNQLGSFAPRRLAGDNRYATSVAVRAEAIRAGMRASEVWLATGAAFPDALAAGPAIAARGGTLLLAAPGDLRTSAPTHRVLTDEAQRIGLVRILGGTAALARQVEQQVTALVR